MAGGMHGGGMCGRWACMAGGMHGTGGVCLRGKVCMAGGMCGGGAWQVVCMADTMRYSQ